MSQLERQRHNKLGESGFYYFFGVIEDRRDPKKLGRVRVRIFGHHTEQLTELPTEELPWAQILQPTSSAVNTMPNMWDGQLVWGFYADGIEKQIPIIVSIVAVDGNVVIDPEGKKSVGFMDQRVKKEVTLIDGKSWASAGVNANPRANPDNYGKSLQKKTRLETKHEVVVGPINGPIVTYKEPDDPFAAQYPFCHTTEFESGHFLEYDDTPGQERIYIFHRTGSFLELLKDGTILHKSIKDVHNICNENQYDMIGKNYERNIKKNLKDQIKGKYDLEISGGDYTINVGDGNLNLTVNGNVTEKITGNKTTKIDGNYTVKVDGNYTVKTGGNYTHKASGNVTIKGTLINLN